MAKIDVTARIAQLHQLLEEATDVRKRMEYLYRLAAYYTNLGSPDADSYIRRALRLALRHGEDYWAAKTCIVRSGGLSNRSDYKGAYRSFRQAWKHLQNLPDCFVDKFHVCRGIAMILAQEQGNMRGALRMLTLAEDYAVRADYPSAVAEVGYATAHIYQNLNLFERSLEVLENTLQIIRNNPDPTLQDRSTWAHTESLFGVMYGQFGAWEAADRKFAESLDIFREIGYPLGEAMLLQDWGNVLFNQGKQTADPQIVENALNRLEEANRIFERIESHVMYGNGMGYIGNVHMYKSDYRSALECFDKGLEFVKTSVLASNDVLVDKAICLMEMGEWEKAVALLKGVENNLAHTFAHTKTVVYESLARAYENLGNTPASLSYYKKWAEADRNVIGIAVQRKLLEIEFRSGAEVRSQGGRAEAAAGDDIPRVELDERAKFARELRNRTDILSHLRDRLAALKNTSADPGAVAGELLAAIEERAERIELWESFDRQLHTVDPVFFDRIAERWASLTPAEARVCSLLRMNLSNKEIGGLLNISDRTVDTHRTSIRKKMGLKKKENLVAFLTAI